MEYKVKSPSKLSRKELVAIVGTLQAVLYQDGPEDGFLWNPDKELRCADLINDLNDLMSHVDLFPMPVGPKDWSPRG